MTQTRRNRSRGRPRESSNQDRGQTVQALDRGLRVLGQVAEHPASTLSDIALLADMSPSTAYRMLETLRGHGMVAFYEDEQTWSVGVDAFRIGQTFARRMNYLEAGRERMRQLTDTTGETSNMAVADGGDVVYISQIETAEPIRAFFPPGTRSCMHASGIGKMLLACMSRVNARRIIEANPLSAFTPNSIGDSGRLFDELTAIRERGWSIDDEEHYLGMRCLAAPVFNEFGEAVAGISISGPTVRLSDARLAELGPIVRASADAVTQAIGGIQRHDPGVRG